MKMVYAEKKRIVQRRNSEKLSGNIVPNNFAIILTPPSGAYSRRGLNVMQNPVNRLTNNMKKKVYY